MNQPRPSVQATVQIDNAQVIVTELRFSAGAETGWHRHGYDYVIVPQHSGQLSIEDAQDNKLVTLEAGKSYYRPEGVEHNVINNNDHEFILIEIELKTP